MLNGLTFDHQVLQNVMKPALKSHIYNLREKEKVIYMTNVIFLRESKKKILLSKIFDVMTNIKKKEKLERKLFINN